MNDTCAFTHGGGTGIGREQLKGNARETPCTFSDGTHVKNHDELWRCMHEANYDITDDWIQMAIFRDPRPAVVSTFYFVEVRRNMNLGDLEAFVARELPIVSVAGGSLHIIYRFSRRPTHGVLVQRRHGKPLGLALTLVLLCWATAPVSHCRSHSDGTSSRRPRVCPQEN